MTTTDPTEHDERLEAVDELRRSLAAKIHGSGCGHSWCIAHHDTGACTLSRWKA